MTCTAGERLVPLPDRDRAGASASILLYRAVRVLVPTGMDPGAAGGVWRVCLGDNGADPVRAVLCDEYPYVSAGCAVWDVRAVPAGPGDVCGLGVQPGGETVRGGRWEIKTGVGMRRSALCAATSTDGRRSELRRITLVVNILSDGYL